MVHSKNKNNNNNITLLLYTFPQKYSVRAKVALQVFLSRVITPAPEHLLPPRPQGNIILHWQGAHNRCRRVVDSVDYSAGELQQQHYYHPH